MNYVGLSIIVDLYPKVLVPIGLNYFSLLIFQNILNIPKFCCKLFFYGYFIFLAVCLQSLAFRSHSLIKSYL